MKPTNYINHIVFVIDSSGSMFSLKNKVIEVFDNQVKYLAERSQKLDQETRVSVYLFNSHNNIQNLFYDKDVLRLPSLKGFYNPDGSTALVDATLKSIDDLSKTAELYGDHAHLIYVISDGFENNSLNSASSLKTKIQSLPENWTLAFFAPSQTSVFEAKSYGFPADNIQIWDTTTKGLEEAGKTMREATETFMTNRSSGVRGTKSLFKLNTNLSTSQVKNTLEELSSSDYHLLNVQKEAVIKPFVESWKINYSPGCAYYQLTKPEKVQAYKQICLKNKRNGKVYSGDKARNLLGLPNHEIRVAPENYSDYDIFIQSSSINRKLIKGSQLIVLK